MADEWTDRERELDAEIPVAEELRGVARDDEFESIEDLDAEEEEEGGPAF